MLLIVAVPIPSTPGPFMQATKPYLEPSVERGVLVLTINRQQIEGEDIALGLKDELLATVAHHGIHKVVLDLKNTRYVSSIAFWPMLALRRQLSDRGGRLIVCGVTGAVYDIFTTTKMVSSAGSLNAPFEMASDREAAVALLAEESASPAS
jgi:anti-anti-sigma factor